MCWVKICGLTCIEDTIGAIKAGADAIGFVFAKSPRRVTLERAKTILSQLFQEIPSKIPLKVGVFVNENIQTVRKIAFECALDMLQFHGDEPPEYCLEFSGYKIIKAFSIKDENSIEFIKKWHKETRRGSVNFYLLDTFVKNKRGGTGRSFNYELALQVKEQGVPIILSGGLNENNVEEVIKKVTPFGVDVSSGVESSPGRKDIDKIQRFINKVRSVECVI